MALERTLSIIKPDCVAGNHIGDIIARFEHNGLRIVAARMLRLTPSQGAQFYAVHADRPFFQELVDFISSGPVLAMVLEGDNAIAENRRIMGATNPKNAVAGTIRADFAGGMPDNAVHGSDAPETAAAEIAFFFGQDEIHAR
ncbi:MAG: nucleoside-diphosphate kinase [Gammaproteobacteria bacterium]|nr:nucleoside-diphosphate kinase [Gammaproteobacteria bacterium]